MKRILILGAGFGGLEAASTLARMFHNSSDVEILVVNDQNFFLFTPLLPQVASSYLDPRHIVQTVRDFRGSRSFRFLRDDVLSLDLSARRVVCREGTLDYDYLVVALGSRTEYFSIPGAIEFTWNYKSLEDAVVLRERILDLCEHAGHTPPSDARRRMLSFIIVGGGYTGVELITELRDLLFGYVARRYRGISASDIRLTLLEASPDVLRGVHPKLAEHAKRRLLREGIDIRTSSAVTRCFPGGVELASGEKLEADTVVWAAGVRAHELIESLPGPHDRIGRAVLNDQLQLEGHPEVFVVGDSAAALSAREAPRVAPVAISQGRVAARNIAHMMRGEPLDKYEYEARGMLVSLGMNHAVVSIGPFRFSGYFAWLFWNAVHLYKLVGFKKQVQVALDWTLAEIFPRDAAIIRRPRRCAICDGESSGQPRKGIAASRP